MFHMELMEAAVVLGGLNPAEMFYKLTPVNSSKVHRWELGWKYHNK